MFAESGSLSGDPSDHPANLIRRIQQCHSARVLPKRFSNKTNEALFVLARESEGSQTMIPEIATYVLVCATALGVAKRRGLITINPAVIKNENARKVR